MARKSEIQYREIMGLKPKSKLSKAQRVYIDDNLLPPDQVEHYFGRRCEYFKISKLIEKMNQPTTKI